MTNDQLRLMELQEQKRHNLAQEKLTKEQNLVKKVEAVTDPVTAVIPKFNIRKTI